MNKREYGNLSFEQMIKLHESTKQCLKEEIDRLTKELRVRLKHYKMAKSARDTIEYDTALECATLAGQTSKVAEHRIKLRFGL